MLNRGPIFQVERLAAQTAFKPVPDNQEKLDLEPLDLGRAIPH